MTFTGVSSGKTGSPDGSAGKESACNAGDTRNTGLILGLGGSPGGGNGNPYQDPFLENPMEPEELQIAWGCRVKHKTE